MCIRDSDTGFGAYTAGWRQGFFILQETGSGYHADGEGSEQETD
jgi:hypothetical protein